MGSSPIGRPSSVPTGPRRIPVLILAGGRASRMGGGDKTLRAVAGRPILAHLLDRIRASHDLVAISAGGDPARFAAFAPDAVLPDPLPGRGPLGGLCAGLDWAHALGADRLLTIPGDTPFVPTDLASRLDRPPAMAASRGRVHPPVALWPVACRPALRAWLDARDADGAGLSVRRFAESLGAVVVGFDDEGDDGGDDPFLDADTPADLAALEASTAARR